jgi:hypothetical protein
MDTDPDLVSSGGAMRFGLMYLFSDFGAVLQDRVFRDVLEEIEYAEALGFDSVWLPEHHFSVYGMLGDTLTLAAPSLSGLAGSRSGPPSCSCP